MIINHYHITGIFYSTDLLKIFWTDLVSIVTLVIFGCIVRVLMM